MAGWTTYDEGEFTLLLPPDYTRVPVQGIDSRVGRWEAPGKRVDYDLGGYSNPLQPNDLDAFPGLEVCQEGDGGDIPRIVRYSLPGGGYAVSAHWRDLRRPGSNMTESLTLEGVVQAAEDQGEFLATIRSVRIQMRDGEGAGADDTASLLTGEEWTVVRLEDTATSGPQRPTLRFATDGALTGDGGCNRYRATYEITGEGLAIGPAVATRRACADSEANAREVRFFALLEQVTRFAITEDGSLELLAIDRPVIVARRTAGTPAASVPTPSAEEDVGAASPAPSADEAAGPPPAPAPPADEAAGPLSPAPLTADGWGPMRIGMTRAEVVAAAGEDANPAAAGGPEPEVCDEFRPARAPEGMRVMIEWDRLTRITLSASASIRTERGFGVGDRAAVIKDAYGADAVISPHKYAPAPAEYITLWMTAPDGPDARGLVYEIGPDGRVAHIHAGGPSIRYVEGCL